MSGAGASGAEGTGAAGARAEGTGAAGVSAEDAGTAGAGSTLCPLPQLPGTGGGPAAGALSAVRVLCRRFSPGETRFGLLWDPRSAARAGGPRGSGSGGRRYHKTSRVSVSVLELSSQK